MIINNNEDAEYIHYELIGSSAGVNTDPKYQAAVIYVDSTYSLYFTPNGKSVDDWLKRHQYEDNVNNLPAMLIKIDYIDNQNKILPLYDGKFTLEPLSTILKADRLTASQGKLKFDCSFHGNKSPVTIGFKVVRHDENYNQIIAIAKNSSGLLWNLTEEITTQSVFLAGKSFVDDGCTSIGTITELISDFIPSNMKFKKLVNKDYGAQGATIKYDYAITAMDSSVVPNISTMTLHFTPNIITSTTA